MSTQLACERLEALQERMPPAQDWLSPQEHARLARITRQARKAQLLAGRWLARELLALTGGGATAHWQLDAPDDAAPAVLGRPELHISISHSGGWVACALARAPVGVDLEAFGRRRDIEGLAALCCTRAERRLLAAAPQPDAFFLALWTVKESWLKRRGEGVSPARLAQLEALPQDDGALRTWQGEGWCLALCAEGEAVHWATPEPAPSRRWRLRERVGA